MDELISRQSVLITVARDKQSKTEFHTLVEDDPAITEYPVNRYVLFTPPVGRSDKLLPRHRGPYQVIEKTTSIYPIENLVDGKRSTTQIHNLRPFNYDPARTSPLVVAQHNEQEFMVGSIHGHRGDRAKRSTIEFQVRWAGFGESCDSWELYKALLAPSIPPGKQDEDPQHDQPLGQEHAAPRAKPSAKVQSLPPPTTLSAPAQMLRGTPITSKPLWWGVCTL